MPRANRTPRFTPHTEPCPECGQDYFKDAHWKTMCWPCYRKAHPERYRVRLTASMASDDTPEMHERILMLTRENLELKQLNSGLKTLTNMLADQLRAVNTRQPAPFTPEMLDRLIRLCHPDRHNNSEASNKATQYLLGLREK